MLNEKKKVPKLQQEVKVNVDIVTSDDIKIYNTGKFQDFTIRCIINILYTVYTGESYFFLINWIHFLFSICGTWTICVEPIPPNPSDTEI